jgi:hypothetical protein
MSIRKAEFKSKERPYDPLEKRQGFGFEKIDRSKEGMQTRQYPRRSKSRMLARGSYKKKIPRWGED